jgi:hypothetical protein
MLKTHSSKYIIKVYPQSSSLGFFQKNNIVFDGLRKSKCIRPKLDWDWATMDYKIKIRTRIGLDLKGRQREKIRESIMLFFWDK